MSSVVSSLDILENTNVTPCYGASEKVNTGKVHN